MGPLASIAVFIGPTLVTRAVQDDGGGDEPALPTAEVVVELAPAQPDQDGPVWTWKQVEVGPCTGQLDEALDARHHRRWTWLSERDGLRVGVCESDTDIEVRLEGAGRLPRPQVDHVVLAFEDRDVELVHEHGRWVSTEGIVHTEQRWSTTFRPEAEARYREVRDQMADAIAIEIADFGFEIDLDDVEPIGGALWDAAEWDLFLDGPGGFGGGLGLDGLDLMDSDAMDLGL